MSPAMQDKITPLPGQWARRVFQAPIYVINLLSNLL